MLALGALTACGTGAAPAPGGPEPQRLTVQAAGGAGELGAVRELVEAFEASRPGVEVDLVGVPDQGDHIAKLATSFAGGSPPDVFLLNYRRLGPFVARGVLAPADATGLDLYDGPVEAFTFDGRLACLPTNASSTVAYVNEALFARAGLPLPSPDWTWADLEAAARALDAAGIAAVGFDVGLRVVAPFVWTAGGQVVDDTDAPTRTVLDSDAGRRALTYLSGLQAYGVDATARAAAEPVDEFAAGRLAVYLDSRRSVPAFRKAAGLAFDVRPLPRAEPATPSTSLLASDAYCVSRASRSPVLAAELARFAAAGEGARVLARSGRTVPVLRSVADSEDFLAPDLRPRSSRVFLDVIPTLRRLPHVTVQDEVEEGADDLLVQYFAGKAGLADTVRAVDDAAAVVYASEK